MYGGGVMGAFIPDQLDQMSKSDLLEFAKTAHEENVKLVQQLAKANERVAKLGRKVEAERFKKAEFIKWVDRLIEEVKELREQRFRRFGEEEYLIFFDDGEDYPESMVAPVVMTANKFRELFYAREQLRKEQDDASSTS